MRMMLYVVWLFLIIWANVFGSSSPLKTAYFRQHGCSTNDTNAKYNSRAAQMYREKIRQQANTALSKYGTDVSNDKVGTVGELIMSHHMYHNTF